MNKLVRITLLFALVILLGACRSSKKIIYLQDVEQQMEQQIAQEFEVKIHKDDLLSIVVNSTNPELAVPFNQPVVSHQIGGNAYGQASLLGYLVDKNGEIDFPILGKVFVEGMSRNQLRDYIKERIIAENYIKDPIVSVKFLNFKVSVIGEVQRPGSFTISGDRITLLEALSMAGDLTIYGKRDRVAVIREEGGERKILFHDLRTSDVFQSPYYYLQQNDIVYVEPNKRKAQQTDINQNFSIGTLISIVSMLTTLGVVIFK